MRRGDLLRVGFVVWTVPWSTDPEAVDDWSVELMSDREMDPHALGYRPRVVHSEERVILDDAPEALDRLARSLTLVLLATIKNSPRFSLLRQRMLETEERKKRGVGALPSVEVVSDRDYQAMRRRLGAGRA